MWKKFEIYFQHTFIKNIFYLDFLRVVVEATMDSVLTLEPRRSLTRPGVNPLLNLREGVGELPLLNLQKFVFKK